MLRLTRAFPQPFDTSIFEIFSFGIKPLQEGKDELAIFPDSKNAVAKSRSETRAFDIAMLSREAS